MIKKSILVVIIVIISIVFYLYFAAKKYSFSHYYVGKVTDHFDGKTFSNYKKNSIPSDGSTVLNYLKNKLYGKGALWPNTIKVNQVKARSIIEQSKSDLIFFVNHATTLVHVEGYNILTDPIWSDYASPLQFLGPKRKAKPGMKFNDLPKIDIVLISHNHYDHLDYQTVKNLILNHNPLFIVGLGMKGTLIKMGVHKNKIIELDWGQDYSVEKNTPDKNQNVKITFLPAQHFSSRFINDKNKTLWGGFVIEYDKKAIYFAGDTGYDEDLFLEIKNKFLNIDIALLPIGAYKPDSFRYVHMNPEEALKASLLLKSKVNIPIHYGTFSLSFENYEDPILDLKNAMKMYDTKPTHFSILQNGQYIDINKILN